MAKTAAIIQQNLNKVDEYGNANSPNAGETGMSFNREKHIKTAATT
jgi:hypothetical protein